MAPRRLTHILLITLTLIVSVSVGSHAQRFKVESFRLLPNDVSAFIDPVRDLNDEDCGLIKIIGSEDFVFSTPLGIVKRLDKTGEIWIYIPRGSKKITIKHPEWGVLRDYIFPTRIDSHLTYELRIEEPLKLADNSVPQPVITTVIDTLMVTRVDTIIVTPVKQPVPLNLTAIATLSFGGRSKTVMGGVMLMAFKRHGGFVHLASDFGKIGTVTGECDRFGEIGGSLPFYSGATRQRSFIVNAGAVHRLSGRVAVFEGLGYGDTSVAWELAPSEGGGFVKNSYYSTRGISFEAGILMNFGRFRVSASVMSCKGTEWYGSVGIGIRIGK
ncbi:MAG: hypothetical protein K2K84_03580 [Muribaculaceae bacterium]|nr:hypothetical protein [Muribaculaceae bacterium]